MLTRWIKDRERGTAEMERNDRHESEIHQASFIYPWAVLLPVLEASIPSLLDERHSFVRTSLMESCKGKKITKAETSSGMLNTPNAFGQRSS